MNSDYRCFTKVLFASVTMGAALTMGGCSTGESSTDQAAGTQLVDSDREGTRSNDVLRARFAPVEAGIEYPTDSPQPTFFDGRKVLVLGNARILVAESARLVSPEAGVDYATEVPIPSDLAGKQVLVVGETTRLVVRLVQAEAGIDYPTDAPPSDAVVWIFGQNVRFDITTLASIEVAIAGVDYPTDVPPQHFAVLSLHSGERIALN